MKQRIRQPGPDGAEGVVFHHVSTICTCAQRMLPIFCLTTMERNCSVMLSVGELFPRLLVAYKYTHSPTTWKFSKSSLRDKNNDIFNSINCSAAGTQVGGGGGGGGGLAANPLCARCLRWWECGDYLALMRARKLVRQRLLNQQQQPATLQPSE